VPNLVSCHCSQAGGFPRPPSAVDLGFDDACYAQVHLLKPIQDEGSMKGVRREFKLLRQKPIHLGTTPHQHELVIYNQRLTIEHEDCYASHRVAGRSGYSVKKSTNYAFHWNSIRAPHTVLESKPIKVSLTSDEPASQFLNQILIARLPYKHPGHCCLHTSLND